MYRVKPVTIVMTTWLPYGEDGNRRLDIAIETLNSWNENLISDDDIYLHIADDGSDESLYKELKLIVSEFWPSNITFSQQQRSGVGASLNTGCKVAFEESDVVLYAVDDWKLIKPLDISPWLEVLEDELVGAVRFFPHPDLTGTIKYVNPGVYAMELDRHHFAFATRPSLWHKRMFDAYGWFDEQVSAYECERFYNDRFCKLMGPKIVLALPDEWQHLGGVEFGDITP